MSSTSRTYQGSTDAISDYLRAIGRIPLLSPDEELHLGHIIQEWKQHACPPRQLERRGRRALDRMVTANLRLVTSICKRYQSRLIHNSLESLDLVQAGNIGLIRAAEKFDPSRGYRFSTYAFWWVRQSVSRFIAENGRTIRVPPPMAQLAARASAIQSRAEQPLSTDDLARRLGESSSRLQQALKVMHQCHVVSLDIPLQGTESEINLGDTISNLIDASDGSIGMLKEDYGWLHQHLHRLDDKERQVINLRLNSAEPLSLAKVADQMNLKKTTVQWLERRALQKLQRALTQDEAVAHDGHRSQPLQGASRSALNPTALNPAAADALPMRRAEEGRSGSDHR